MLSTLLSYWKDGWLVQGPLFAYSMLMGLSADPTQQRLHPWRSEDDVVSLTQHVIDGAAAADMTAVELAQQPQLPFNVNVRCQSSTVDQNVRLLRMMMSDVDQMDMENVNGLCLSCSDPGTLGVAWQLLQYQDIPKGAHKFFDQIRSGQCQSQREAFFVNGKWGPRPPFACC